MNSTVSKIKCLMRQHWLALAMAVFIALIYGLPYVWFQVASGSAYRGIPMIAVANEDFYIARMREILDGHPLVASHMFFEYKDQYPLSPPAGEFLYVLPVIIFGVSLITVLLASKFILPAILFLLVYFFIYQLTNNENSWPKKLNALAGAFLVVLGYDLIDYRTLIKLITGEVVPGGWLLWARPVHPILGALFIFLFLIGLVFIIKRKHVKIGVAVSSLSLSLMIMSYFFSWGVAVSVLFVLLALYLLKRNYPVVKNFLLIFLFTAAAATPYWYISILSRRSAGYHDALLHSGLFVTHYPIFNKVLIVALVFFIAALSYLCVYKKKQWRTIISHDWVIISFALILGGLAALNQQIITGMTIWPFHFVQYTIPLSMVVVCVIFYNIVRKRSKFIWSAWVVFIIGSSVFFGVYNQIKAYQNNYDYYYKLQSYMDAFDWLNQQDKDVVVLALADKSLPSELNFLITAFTSSNVYADSAVFSTIMPTERRYHNYFTMLCFKGINGANIGQYIKENEIEARLYLFSNWVGLYGVKLFPDFQDLELNQRIKSIPDRYREFLKKELSTTLVAYRLDFILSAGPLPSEIMDQIPGLSLSFSQNNIFIYSL